MPHIRKDEAPILLDEPVVTIRSVELDDTTVSFETYPTDYDPAHLFRGLPDDRCQCRHWGVMIKGRLDVHYADRSESFTAGDAYYILPGHTPHPHAGTELIEFSPTADLQKSMAVIGANMEAEAANA